jgi:hypothetical protein
MGRHTLYNSPFRGNHPCYGFTYSQLCLSKINTCTSEVPEACGKEKHPFNNLIKAEKLNQVISFIYKIIPPSPSPEILNNSYI